MKVRLGIERDNYKVVPGLYAIGSPNETSPVLVTANYKLTVDQLRKELNGANTWILVIDTKGVNVWCAAGKGTFSTEEIIYRVLKSKLKQLVSHNTLILPQLGAPGVSAYEVTKYTGFKVVYGPVYAKDIKGFLENNHRATKEMRRVDFGLVERITVVPLETVMTMKYLPFIFLFFILLQLVGGKNEGLLQVVEVGMWNTLPYVIGLMIGTLLFPVLLPILPFRMFSMKAFVLGIIWSGIVIHYGSIFHYESNMLVAIGNTLVLTSIISFLGMNFTGSTTFTSLSGVKKETIITVPLVGVATVLGIILLVVDKLV